MQQLPSHVIPFRMLQRLMCCRDHMTLTSVDTHCLTVLHLQYFVSRPVVVARRTLRVLWAAARWGSGLGVDYLQGAPPLLLISSPYSSLMHACLTAPGM